LSHGFYPGAPLPLGVLPSLNSVGFWDAAGMQDWGLEPHRNEGLEVVFLETGRMLFTVDVAKYPIEAGAVTITRPWQLHCLGDPHIGPGRLHWLILDVGVRRPHQHWRWPPWVVLAPDDLRELARRLRHNAHPVWQGTPDIAHAFAEVAACVRAAEHAPPAVSRLVIHVNHLLLSLLEALRNQCPGDVAEPALIHRSIGQFLEELARSRDLLARAWTLKTLADSCRMKPTVFVQRCRQTTNQSPMDYLNRCRLDHAARRLLGEPGTPVAKIAAESGFSTSQYFSTRFRQRFHCTPRAYRRRAGAPAVIASPSA